MISLAGRDILHAWGKFIFTGIGLGLLIGVTLTMAGVYRGMVDDGKVLLDNSGADLWVVQKDTLGPYEVHDFFLYHFQRFGASPDKLMFMACRAFDGVYSREQIEKWLRLFMKRFFSQQFKRSCIPDGPKVGSVTLSPRGDWRMPSDASAALWLAELEEIE